MFCIFRDKLVKKPQNEPNYFKSLSPTYSNDLFIIGADVTQRCIDQYEKYSFTISFFGSLGFEDVAEKKHDLNSRFMKTILL